MCGPSYYVQVYMSAVIVSRFTEDMAYKESTKRMSAGESKD